jgi:hypothetical protein
MELRKSPSRDSIIVDLAGFQGFHGNGEPFLVVEVKAMKGVTGVAAEWLVNLLIRLREFNGYDIPFGMVVDLEDILVFDTKATEPLVPICRFKTAEILVAYDPDFARKRIFDDYLLGLVETWLGKFGWRTTLDPPPGMKEFAEAGLAELLAGSSFYSQVPLADADPVR